MSDEKKPVKGKTKQEAAPVMYIGPNDLARGLKTYTVYKERPTDLITALQEQYKTVGRLFVPVGSANKAREDLQKQGTPINLAYREMMQ